MKVVKYTGSYGPDCIGREKVICLKYERLKFTVTNLACVRSRESLLLFDQGNSTINSR